MSKIEKLTLRLQSKPKDFTWQELKKILANFGYEEKSKSKVGGSRVKFIHSETRH
ncbi:MAG: hypothetical protein ACR2PY_05675 [Salinispira sp.]